MSCKGCAYAALLSGAWCCDYLCMTGHRRPCPPGEGCTVRKEGDLTKKGSAFMKRRGWDTEKAKALYDLKLSDTEIAGKVGATASAVAFWRRGLGLPANPGHHPPPRPEIPEPKAVPPPPVSPPPRPLALPITKGPVEMSVEMDGHAFVLRAPDLEGAARIHSYAGRLLEDMGRIAAEREEGTDDA